MKELVVKSIKQNTIVTTILAIVCIGLISLSIIQNIQYRELPTALAVGFRRSLQ